MANESENAATQSGQKDGGQLAIQKIYIKDLSFESPNAPGVFTEQLNPQVDVHFGNATTDLGDNNHEVVLSVTVTVKEGERSVYLVEIQQAGVFTIAGFPAEHLQPILATACPNILFPYAREAISDVVTKGGFPQLLLAPVNFDVLYAQELQRRQQAAAAQQH